MTLPTVKSQKANTNEAPVSFDASKWNAIISVATKETSDDSTRNQAEALGIEWERPKGDNRSAKYIIENSPMLKDLIDHENGGKGRPDVGDIKDGLKKLVGDYENDSDAAFRADQVLEHIEKFDSDGNLISGKDVGNGKIDGITDSDQVEHGTEAGRLKDLAKYGFEHLKGDLIKSNTFWGDQKAREDAARLGIKWVTPEGDNRSAEDIINDNPLLKNLGNQSGVKDKLKDRVGDFEHDRDAAYRAVQVLEHIEKFDDDGKIQDGKNVGNDEINGFTKSGEAEHGTEAGRLQDFGKYGFENLKGELPDQLDPKDNKEARKEAEALGIEWVRPEGDQRSAKEIIDDNPLLKNLQNHGNAKDMLKERVGDFDRDADAAFRAAQVLKHVEKFDGDGKLLDDKKVGNEKIDGYTSSNEAKHGTEAGRLQDFGKYGFRNLKGNLHEVPAKNDAPPTAPGKEPPADGKPGSGEIIDEKKAHEQAEALGIEWKRPKDDDRSAKSIIKDTPMLSDLIDRKGSKNRPDIDNMKEDLKKRVGDYENDADAAYRAAQVLKHIEKFDSDGKINSGKDVGNDKIDGITDSDEVRHGTEAGRLKDFGKYGFENLKGKFPERSESGKNEEARKQAEALGIKWDLPKYDKRDAGQIIDDSPLLKNLGNQSGVKDMLKDRVGDFEHDRDAAYRAVQVLERIEKYDAEGKMLSGDDVGNHKIDGFSPSGEAKHGTEAGRLQDFGKFGFSSLAGVSDKYGDYLKKNGDADDASKLIAKYGSALYENFDSIKDATGAGDHLTIKDLQKFKDENPKLMSDDLKKALDFWSKPGSFDILETSHDKLRNGSDGKLSKTDISDWLSNDAPKDAKGAIEFAVRAADGNAVSDVQVEKFDDEIFKNPEKYSPKEKAAVVRDLQKAYDLVGMGKQAGMWDKDYIIKKLGDRAGVGGDPEAVLKEIQERITTLQKDPEVVKFLNETGEKTLKDFVDSDKDLKSALMGIYDKDIKTGAELDKSWKSKSDDGKAIGPTENLANFFQMGKMYQGALGINDTKALQGAVKNSKHNGELQEFYEKSMVSGDRLKELLKDHSAEEAISTFSLEAALYNAALDPEFTGKYDKKLNENFTSIAEDGAFKNASFDDLKKAFGVNGGDELDEKQVEKMIEEIGKTNPESLVNANGEPAKPDQILAAFRGQWELLRQGTKGLGAYGVIDANNSAKQLFDKGIQHGVSGLLLSGITIARGIGANGNLTDRQKADIAIGSVQTAAIFAEGGVKNYREYLKNAGIDPKKIDDPKTFNEYLQKNASRFEFGFRGLGGGLANLALGAYSIFDGVKAIRNGDVATGGVSIATGSIGLLGGAAVTVEGGMGVAGLVVPRLIQGLGAGFGVAGGVLSLASVFIFAAINESKASSLQNDYGDLLGDYLKKYKIDGKADDSA
ncbi:type III effector HrpK (plasmid) [Phyllobacterium sp. 628]|uniref:type III effector HrpK domain-containing protein n=1 Tax=Phyllobacterium sp. 628 TaxID=2718938 RepID=UPI0016628C0E|nr:type III effector HrpK domain-containing protein [Phyllobacterium sp. 628]QND54781.1 type III effector HrpK [Phyllobacterium sp. 628]